MSSEQKAGMGGLELFSSRADQSWLTQLTADPLQSQHEPNRRSREVNAGHYVQVDPMKLASPYLVAYSPEMAAELGLDAQTCTSEAFAAFFSGDSSILPAFKPWATPYALSIYGQEMYQNCPFGNGNGYGDGRAISIAEVLLPSGQRWETQLKGAGPTPFCRGGDGRAVLRSSVREFLVSEAMYHMGVSTTRALSLVASRTMTVDRPWFSAEEAEAPALPSVDDPRLAHLPLQQRKMVIQQLAARSRGPDIMQTSAVAMTCRVAPSFMRVGHVELHGRRATKTGSQADIKALKDIVEHCLFREFPDINAKLGGPGSPLQPRVLAMAAAASERIATLTAGWLRVGYCQGNFNSDNCLVAGRTMDYGPFGFIEKFEPLWNMWSGGGEHFAFMNQHTAGGKNFESLSTALLPLVDAEGKQHLQQLASEHGYQSKRKNGEIFTAKLGLKTWDAETEKLLNRLLVLMEDSQADYTITWRQLAVVAEAAEADVAPLQAAFYQTLTPALTGLWTAWLKDWRGIATAASLDGGDMATCMRQVSPKFVPREWMLVEAYTQAIAGDVALVAELQAVFRSPFEEQSTEVSDKYYRKTPASTYAGAGKGGTAYMT